MPGTKGLSQLPPEQALEFIIDMLSVHREVTLTVADKLDQLLAGPQPAS